MLTQELRLWLKYTVLLSSIAQLLWLPASICPNQLRQGATP